MSSLKVALVILAIIISLSACTTTSTVYKSASPSPAPIATRSFLLPSETLSKSTSADQSVRGFLIFRSRPSHPIQKARYNIVCSAYLDEFVHSDSFGSEYQVLPTYWLLNREITEENCSEMLASYHYIRANKIVSRLNISLGVGQGPFLVAEGKGEKTLLDMSNFSDDDLYHAVRIWRSRISTDPKYWQPKSSMNYFLEDFKDIVKKYGKGVFSVFN